MRPTTAQAVARLSASPAPLSPRLGARMENSTVSSPICAVRPRAKASDRLRKAGWRQSGPVGGGAGRGGGGLRRRRPGAGPSPAGVGRNQRPAIGHATSTVATATRSDAAPKPQAAMSAAQSGKKTMPPALAPL